MTTPNRNTEWHELLAIFAGESLEQMDTVEAALLKLDGVESGEPSVHRDIAGIFRLFHSLKGGAASLELNVLRDATHQAENLLQLFTDGNRQITADHVDLMCRTCDLARKGLQLAQTTGQDEDLAQEAGILILALNCELSRLRGEPDSQPQQQPPQKAAVPPGQQAIVRTLLFDTLNPPPNLLSSYGSDRFPAFLSDLDIPLSPAMRAGFAREGTVLLEQGFTALQEDRDTQGIGPAVILAFRHLAGHATFFGYTWLQTCIDDQLIPLFQQASQRHPVWPESYCQSASGIFLKLTDHLELLGASTDDPLSIVPPLDDEIKELSGLLAPEETAGSLFTDFFPRELLDDCREETTLLLAEIQTNLEELGSGERDRELLAGLSRAFHSIKGATGLLMSATTREINDQHPLRVLMRVIHEIENRLGFLQSGEVLASQALNPIDFDFLRDSHTATRHLIDLFFAGEPVPIELPKTLASCLAIEVQPRVEPQKPKIQAGKKPFAASLDEMKLPITAEIRTAFSTEGSRLCELAGQSLADARESEDDAGALLQTFKMFHALGGLAQFFGFPEIRSLCKITEALIHCLLSGLAVTNRDQMYDAISSGLDTLTRDCAAIAQAPTPPAPSSIPAESLTGSTASSSPSSSDSSSVAERMQKILDAVNSRQAQAELFTPGTRLEDLFEPQMMKDFRENGEQLLQTVEELLAGILPDTECRKDLGAAMRGFHSIKGNAALMISGAQAPLPMRHPLQFIRAVAHGGEALLAASRDNPLGSIEAHDHQDLTRCIEVFRTLREDFFSGKASGDVPLDLLQKLGLSIGQFRQTDLTLLNQCMTAFFANPETVDRAQVLAFLQTLNNLTEVCTRLGRSDLFISIRAQQQLLDLWLAEPVQISFAQTLAKLSEQYQDFLKLIQKPAAALPKPVPAVEKTRTTRDESADAGSRVTLRVDEEKVDRLLRLVGELVMARNPFAEAANALSGQGTSQIAQDIRRADTEVARLANELQRTVNSIRMLPVRSVFQRFPRLVRVLAKDLGKELQLIMHGENTEVDKTVVELLADPLVHLIRNSVDHGIELPEERKKQGKPAEGTVRLSAITEGNLVTISVSDDGKGLDPERLKRKAIEKGLITSEAAAKMSEQESFNLVLLAGFSTAEKLTDVSGRGVGMDVVATNIRRLHGTIDIASKIGQGSTFSLKIPANYIQAILVRSQDAEYLLPVDAVSCLIKIPAREVHEYRQNRLVTVRGRVFPYMPLSELLGRGAETLVTSGDTGDEILPLAVLESSAGRLAVGVDRFLGEMQVMIKPLASELGENRLFAGASIMGDGRIVLVLNPQELSQQAATRLASEEKTV